MLIDDALHRNDTIRNRILDALREGASYRLAAAAAGLDDQFIARWMADDPEFAEQVRQHKATASLAMIRKVRTADDWKAAAWYLERTERADFGPESKVTVETPDPNAARRALAELINPRSLIDDEGE